MTSTTFTHRRSTCPGCGQALNASVDPKERGGPRPNDVSMCVGCGTILQFDQQLRLKAMTPEQIERLPPKTAEELLEQQERWRVRNKARTAVVVP